MHSRPAGKVHVWWLPLPTSKGSTDRFWDVLSCEERIRADRFVTNEARDRFVVTRGTLRMLLAARLGGDPQALDLRFGSLGKPEVPNANVWFNVSHTPGLAVIAISRASPVGIDVERIDPSVDVVGVARLAFGKARGSELSHLRGPDRITNFFKAWVEEEARVKMVGGSIATTISGEAMTDLEVVALEPPRVGFAAALAGRGPLEVVVERDRS